jgi:hypothetical protein
MHSHDRTLVSQLGFADPDKKDSRHDLACQYLSQPEMILKLVGLVAPEESEVRGVRNETPIRKGEGQYQSTVGFLDIYVYCGIYSVAVEVKVNPIGIGDMVRQFNLYRQYAGSIDYWVLATTFVLSPIDLDSLKRERIRHVLLGPRFEAWCSEQERARADAGPSKDSLVL